MKIYLIEKHPHHEIGWLQKLNCKYLITYAPEPGDKVVARFNAREHSNEIVVETVSYDQEHSGHVWKITSVAPRFQLGKPAISRQVLAQYALEIFMANLGQGESPGIRPVEAEYLGTTDDITSDAQIFEHAHIPEDAHTYREIVVKSILQEFECLDKPWDDECFHDTTRVKAAKELLQFVKRRDDEDQDSNR